MSENNTTTSATGDMQSWILLLILSVLWGASFLFIGIAVKELAALEIVLARVGVATAILIPLHLVLQGPLPRDAKTWVAGGGMSIMNNVIPFSLIVYGQHFITAGLASVINATTPIFGALALAAAGMEALTGRRIFGLLLGVAGVVVLRGVTQLDSGAQTIGILCVLLASMSYGVSGVWAKKRLAGIAPLTTATCQLTVSTVLMAVLATMFSEPATLFDASKGTWFAIIGLASLSTALAYLLFFRIIQRSGPSLVLLVTMLIPVSAISMGALFLNEAILSREIIGALIIGIALLVIDGRVFNLVKR
jgi:drug/metabolite transporter (DMT)-like permease